MSDLAYVAPIADADHVDAVYVSSQGGSTGNLSVRLSASGSEPATHRGGNTAEAPPELQALLEAAGAVCGASWTVLLSNLGLQRIDAGPSF
jgi:hypothetical protein